MWWWLIDWWWWWCMMIESWCDGWWNNDYYKVLSYVNSKTNVLHMISIYYIRYVMIVDHALIVSFFLILVCLFLVSLPLHFLLNCNDRVVWYKSRLWCSFWRAYTQGWGGCGDELTGKIRPSVIYLCFILVGTNLGLKYGFGSMLYLFP